MLNELAYAQGVEDGLAKFAIMSGDPAWADSLARIKRLTPVTARDPAIENAIAAHDQTPTGREFHAEKLREDNDRTLMDRFGPVKTPLPSTTVKPVIHTMPMDPTGQKFVPGGIPKITAALTPPAAPSAALPVTPTSGLSDPGKTVNARIPGTPAYQRR